MPVRLLRAHNGQAAGTLYWGPDEDVLRSAGTADDDIKSATDYQDLARIVTGATATATRNAIVYRMTSASPQTITIPPSGFWPVGTVLSFVQIGAGAFTIVPATGVTINTALSSLVSKGQWNVGQLLKIDANSWIAFGGMGS